MSANKNIWNDQNYLILKNTLSPEVCELLADYVRFKAGLKLKTHQDFLPGVHREYGDLLMETILSKLTPQIEAATGMALWSTLSFCYLYRKGDTLAPHKDRSSCEIVAGLCIGADETFKKEHPDGGWPLMINNNGESTAIPLNYGDLVIFKGSETEHWREAFTGEWFVSAIFAYVDKNGPLSFQKYDQRKRLGVPHIGMFRWCYGCIKDNLKKRLGIHAIVAK